MGVGLSGQVGVFCGRQVGAADPGASVFFCQLFPLLLTLFGGLIFTTKGLLNVVEAVFYLLLDLGTAAKERYHEVGVLLQCYKSWVLELQALLQSTMVWTEGADSVKHFWFRVLGHVDVEATKL